VHLRPDILQHERRHDGLRARQRVSVPRGKVLPRRRIRISGRRDQGGRLHLQARPSVLHVRSQGSPGPLPGRRPVLVH